MLAEMPLNRLRNARNLTQEHLAGILRKDQSAISQMERRSDMYVHTNFPEGSIRITGLTPQ